MSITKLTADSTSSCSPKKGVRWCLQDRHADGRTVHRHFTHEARAKQTEIELRAERIGGAPIVRRSKRTVRSYAEEWRQAQTWKDADVARYALKRAYPLIGDKQLSAITGLSVQAVQKQLLGRHAYGSADLTMHFLKRVLRRAHQDRLIPSDPTVGVTMPRRDSLDRSGIVTAEQVPTREEALAIIDGAPTAYRAGVALGLGCGLRVGEVLGLSPNRVDLKAGTLTIDRQWQRRGIDSPKTWRGVRTIEAPDRVLEELAKLLHPWVSADLPIFTGARGGVLRREDFYARAWRPALRAAGLASDRYVFHSTRHYAVSAMLAEGVTPVEVAAYVGDTVATITSTYSHWLRDSVPMAKRALDRALSDPERHKFATSSDD